jgi:hypothetical protein
MTNPTIPKAIMGLCILGCIMIEQTEVLVVDETTVYWFKVRDVGLCTNKGQSESHYVFIKESQS